MQLKYITDDLKGTRKIWLLGNNFLAETFRKSFKKSKSEFFIKYNYEVTAHCSSKYSDKNSNSLSRITNTFIQAMNTKYYLPEYIIIFLDDDLIEFLQYKKYAVASLLGP